ncbi:D-alanyl-D-alanine carboxypeptidase family protein [Paractinoplanes durhamensis]|uniref:D-alanyl-D-alanine carboxypeptidase family protein n=1 Tax=Paractinoplanes durhamensis TaxID=113563 RepID=UPI001EF39D4E|nr:D-alanyl-D-alanine carboxypeptidase family protein [Actinoplanes durhamensis]
MTTRPEHPKSARARRFTAALIIAAVGGTIASPAGPAEAVVPTVAQTWSTLMYRSLTADAQLATLRQTLTAAQATFATRVGEVSAAKATNGAAQARLTAATTADADARAQLAAAVQAATDAKKSLAKASKVKPRSAAAIAKATGVVNAAVKTVNTRKVQVERASGVRNEAATAARTATTGLTTAIAGWKAASVAISQTQVRIAGVGSAPVLAGQAAALSQTVVTQIRPAFTIADTAQVYGVTVHKNVAFAFRRMVDDAKADGIAISGGGFRTKQRQIELRTINGCPDVWTAPASSCRVPTAIPGRSLHEIGMAVDITSGGRTLTSKSPAFAWLKLHAAEYGFINLPAEAWHWSITGG